MRASTRYLALVQPSRANTDGLLLSLGHALVCMGINDLQCSDLQCSDQVLKVDGKPVLVGAGTDGASVNVGVHGGLRGKFRSTLMAILVLVFCLQDGISKQRCFY